MSLSLSLSLSLNLSLMKTVFYQVKHDEEAPPTQLIISVSHHRAAKDGRQCESSLWLRHSSLCPTSPLLLPPPRHWLFCLLPKSNQTRPQRFNESLQVESVWVLIEQQVSTCVTDFIRHEPVVNKHHVDPERDEDLLLELIHCSLHRN